MVWKSQTLLIIFIAVVIRLIPFSIAYRHTINVFKCKTGSYISRTNICNGTPECTDKSDESEELCKNIQCPPNFFRCDYGGCIPELNVCNGFPDCIDSSDEEPFLCQITDIVKEVSFNLSVSVSYKLTTNQFHCKSGQRISEFDVCDGIPNCADQSDETADLCSTINCPEYAFRCNYGACINKNNICNQNVDCVDASDENVTYCSSLLQESSSINCPLEIFECKSGEVISEYNVCDGTAECDDQTDENETTCLKTLCPAYSFRCKYGACVKGNAKCNGIIDCLDGSDEDYILCGDKLTSSEWIWNK